MSESRVGQEPTTMEKLEAAWETEERRWRWITRAYVLYFVVMIAAFIWKGLS